jgi:hypothetical protein
MTEDGDAGLARRILARREAAPECGAPANTEKKFQDVSVSRLRAAWCTPSRLTSKLS